MNKRPVAIISTDKHLKEDNVDELYNLAEQEIELAKDNSVDIVIWLGDIFDSRLSQRQEILVKLSEILNLYEKAEIKILCIPGNHDKTNYTEDESFLTPFRYHPNFKLIEYPKEARYCFFNETMIYFHFVPFYSQEVWLEKFKTLPDVKGKNAILLSHTAVQGSINNDGKKVESKIKTSLFKEYKAVFLGHYHDAQQPAKNVFHLPAVRQNNFGEDEEKGFTILYEDISFDFVKSSFKPYKTIEVNTLTATKEELINVSKLQLQDSNVRVILTGDQQSVKSVDKKLFTKNGMIVKTKYIDVEVPEENDEVVQELTGSDIKQKFKTFCDEKRYKYEEGLELLKEIMLWE